MNLPSKYFLSKNFELNIPYQKTNLRVNCFIGNTFENVPRFISDRSRTHKLEYENALFFFAYYVLLGSSSNRL